MEKMIINGLTVEELAEKYNLSTKELITELNKAALLKTSFHIIDKALPPIWDAPLKASTNKSIRANAIAAANKSVYSVKYIVEDSAKFSVSKLSFWNTKLQPFLHNIKTFMLSFFKKSPKDRAVQAYLRAPAFIISKNLK